ncbi:hypothetical protein KIPB_006016, partial [Kipferlia bialata]
LWYQTGAIRDNNRSWLCSYTVSAKPKGLDLTWIQTGMLCIVTLLLCFILYCVVGACISNVKAFRRGSRVTLSAAYEKYLSMCQGRERERTRLLGGRVEGEDTDGAVAVAEA